MNPRFSGMIRSARSVATKARLRTKATDRYGVMATRTAPSALLPAHTYRSMASSSVSSAEVDKFSGMDQEWWDPQKNPLIYMNATRVQYIRTMVETELRLTPSPPSTTSTSTANATSNSSSKSRSSLPFSGLKALDIGCGGGLLSESLARLGASVTGIDPSEKLLAAAQQHAAVQFGSSSNNNNRPTYLNTTAEELAASSADTGDGNTNTDTLFDMVCLLEVIEHASDQQSLLAAASALVKPGGLLFVSTINKTWKSHALAIVGAEYIMGYLPVGTHNWKQFLSPQQVQDYLAAQTGDLLLEPVQGANSVTGMVLASPPWPGRCWDWKLDPNDTDVNWIGTYQRREL